MRPFQHIIEFQLEFLQRRFDSLLLASPLAFSQMTPSKIPDRSGVYLITAALSGREDPYYVGRTKNLRRRLYNNHLMGPFSNARLKNCLVSTRECEDIAAAKGFLKSCCSVRWIEQAGHRERGAIEGYATALLFPKHGIYEEH
ncbi:MAG: GIY-YIG nuclease family protein [Candidatus Sulfotelmatobacter sp.]